MLLGLSVRSHEGLHVLPYGSASALRLRGGEPFRRRTAQGERPAAGSFGGGDRQPPGGAGGGGESATWGRTLNLGDTAERRNDSKCLFPALVRPASTEAGAMARGVRACCDRSAGWAPPAAWRLLRGN
ncbi:hypothetical protein GCM10010289_34630 [Streptomyces violascens]|uniref:Uncharacterized protein n=1 Tax=Streptomyces violascens TaxID=67381 RepID=A0ABQ3R193_9ACTN|nr:hypothetical protein GCM10010289_34630 [Streptomyces violascens]GHI43287.1 hypothetical protein Sviol_76950 [Streptomyces violascens]